MKKCKKVGSFILTIIFVLSIFSGCASKSASSTATSSGKVTIKFLHKWPQPQNMPYFKQVVSDFEKLNPNIKVDMEAVDDTSIKDKLRVLMGSNSQPDIYFSWSGEFAKKFIKTNNAYDLTSALNSDENWKNSFMKAGLEPFTLNGKNYGIPLRINGKFFVYNKEIFNKYNLTEPKTWDEFLNVCSVLKKAGVTPIAFGDKEPWAACHYITGLNQKLVPQATRMSDYELTKADFSDSGYIKALNLFKELNDKQYFNLGSNSIDHNMAVETFGQEKQAMIYVELEEFKDINDKLKGKQWGFFPMPTIVNGAGNQNFITGAPDGFMVSNKSKHPKEAIEFLKFLTNKVNSENLVKTLGWPSPVIGAVNEKDSPAFLINGMKALQDAQGMALWLDTDINGKIIDVYLPNLQELLNGTKTPEKIMGEVQVIAKQVKSEQ